MGIRKSAPRKARQDAHVTLGPLRTSHKTALKKIWDERPCLPSITSRKAWARARGIDPTFVNRWFYVRAREARESGFELDIENESYDLDVNTTPERYSILHSTTPEGLPELSHYEHSTASETGLRIPLSPGQSSSPIFGSSFYSPKLTLDSPSSAYGHLIDVERFIFTPPSPPRRSKTLPPPYPPTAFPLYLWLPKNLDHHEAATTFLTFACKMILVFGCHPIPYRQPLPG
ncbi:hypothetical protein BJ322DRAFT_1107137 [Thelephora terrestris]|uniref:Homeobox domain-containing protein n=1 Tax=Thelephora terrestris TaxID=56493 RepID=A0A9P6HHI3_9AGAM|nr:hypothetical protein BJ322DRAFT_1107137 [Thelephora terrestris]